MRAAVGCSHNDARWSRAKAPGRHSEVSHSCIQIDVTPSTERLTPPDALQIFGNGGARRNRTADLLHAMQALSQLSYGPLPFRLTLVHLNPGSVVMRFGCAIQTQYVFAVRVPETRSGSAPDQAKLVPLRLTFDRFPVLSRAIRYRRLLHRG